MECLPWIDVDDLEGDTAYADAFEAATPDQREAAAAWSSNILWKRTKGKFGLVTLEVDVCPPGPCQCAVCCCGPQHLLKISETLPVVEITEVTNVISSVVIDPARYKIVNDRWLGLIDRFSCGWTTDYASSLHVEFEAGTAPDAEAKEAAVTLGGEYLRWKTGLGACRLPLKAEQLKMVPRGRGGRRDVVLFGIPTVDQFLLDSLNASPSGMMDPAALAYTLR